MGELAAALLAVGDEQGHEHGQDDHHDEHEVDPR
jgi:hypothetical protein